MNTPRFNLHDRVSSPAGAALITGIQGKWYSLNLLDGQGRRTTRAFNCSEDALSPLTTRPYTQRTSRTRRIIQAVTPPIPVRPDIATRIAEAVGQVETESPQFRESEPREGVLIILPGQPGGYDAMQSLSRRADEQTAQKWAGSNGKARYTQAVDKHETAAERAARWKREANEDLYQRMKRRVSGDGVA